MKSRTMSRRGMMLWSVLGFLLGMEMVGAPTAWAIPAWARKYGTSCMTCHQPNVPRLSTFGHQFRKLGYRVAEEVGKQPEYKEIGQYLAMRGRLRYDYEDFRHARNTNGFRWNDATLFYAGPVTPNLSTFFELEVNESNELEPLGQMSWLFGGPDRYAQIRIGQFHSLNRVGWAGFDRPSGINTTKVTSAVLTTTAVPFTFASDQRGAELTVGLNKNTRLIGQVLNGLNTSGSGTTGTRDSDASKDFLLAYEQMLGDRGSGVSAVFYRGVWKQAAGTVVNGTALVDDDAYRQFDFYRYGVTGSWVFKSPLLPKYDGELQGGALFAHDDGPQLYPGGRPKVNGYGLFLGAEQRFKDASVFSRVDVRNLDATGGTWRRRFTLGLAKMVNDYLRLSLEGFYNNDEASTDSAGFNAEAMVNF